MSFRDVLLLVVILRLTRRESLRFSQIGLSLSDWQWNLVIGFAASVLQTGFRYGVLGLLQWRKRYSPDTWLLEWPVVHWIGGNLFSVLAQEAWIAFCIVALRQTGHSVLVSLVLVGTAFGAAHSYRFFRALPPALEGVTSASLFLWRGSLLPSYVFHFVWNMVSFHLARRAAREVRPN
jgi:hypothetical protein